MAQLLLLSGWLLGSSWPAHLGSTPWSSPCTVHGAACPFAWFLFIIFYLIKCLFIFEAHVSLSCVTARNKVGACHLYLVCVCTRMLGYVYLYVICWALFSCVFCLNVSAGTCEWETPFDDVSLASYWISSAWGDFAFSVFPFAWCGRCVLFWDTTWIDFFVMLVVLKFLPPLGI